ncbi:hypothetical protein WI25_06020 [Burkholderia cepacia]|uniref:hypothetical protein n=1 Tax=Burkholderia cepacia TaxID=292 RepID=UPI0007573630|nr:hypothetical protein [Burkholderia cepacia]KUY77642.1 hypothetical protein WI25_06020 [Burkholderia cepacia]
MKQKNKSLKDSGMFARLWEDTIILALRDLQWHKAVQTEGGKPVSERTKIKPPSALLKLDGNAETALGDAITSANDRFFLFEFKSDAREGGSEFKKPLVHIMKAVAGLSSENPERELFEQDSRAAHHFVFPEYSSDDVASDGEVATRKAIVATDGYYDVAVEMKDDNYRLSKKTDIVSMLYSPGKHAFTYGLALPRMAAYLSYLVQRYADWEKAEVKRKEPESETKDVNVPMKALIWSDAGFFWPCADMSNLQHVAQVLRGYHYTLDLQTTLVQSGYPNPLSTFDFPQPGADDDSATSSRTTATPKSKRKRLG